MKKEIQTKIEKNIHQFDLCSLIRVLKSQGIDSKNIYFESNTIPSSCNHLCQKISFQDSPPHVTITLNMGLLHPSSPIPSYFQKLIDSDEIDGDTFLRFLSFFNHRLLNTFVQMSLPETNETLFASWRQTKLYYLSLLGLESISTLSFFFKICFPDLVVEVKKNPQVMKLHSSSLILGKDCLGYSSFIGNRFQETLSSFKVIFSTDNEVTELGTPWPIEINKRLLELIHPVLKKTDIHLSIALSIKSKSNYLTLGSHSFLGYDRIGKSAQPFHLSVFFGLIKDLKRRAASTAH